MRNDAANDRRRRVPLVHEDYCCGCGVGMPYVPTPGKNRAVTIWCESCVPTYPPVEDSHVLDQDEGGERECPRCGCVHTWPTEDHLCEKCEGEWVEECTGNWPLD